MFYNCRFKAPESAIESNMCNLFKMKKIFYHVLRHAMALSCVVGGLLSANAVTVSFEAKEPVELGKTYVLDTNNQSNYLGLYFTPQNDGYMTIMQLNGTTTPRSHLLNSLPESINTGTYSGDYMVNPENYTQSSDKYMTTFQYKLTGGVTYYYYSAYGLSVTSSRKSIAADSDLKGILFSYVEGDVPESKEIEAIPENNPTSFGLKGNEIYSFTPSDNVNLTVISDKELDCNQYEGTSILYKDQLFIIPVITSESYQEPGGNYYYEFINLEKGRTYFVKNSSDANVFFNTEEVTKINEPSALPSNKYFCSYKTELTYDIDSPGTLIIYCNKYNNGWAMFNGAFPVYYLQEGSTKYTYPKPSDSSNKEPYSYSYVFEEPTTVFFKNEMDEDYIFYFEFIPSSYKTSQLIKVLPEPGKAYNVADYSQISIYFDPEDVQIGSAEFTYTPVGESEPVTVSIRKEYTGQNFWVVPITQYYLQSELGAETSLVLKDVNYKKQPVNETTLDYGDNLTVDQGTITIKYPRPEVILGVEGIETDAIYRYKDDNFTFYNWWNADEKNGKISYDFNLDIEKVGEVKLIFGEHSYGNESGGEETDPTFTVPYEINGKTLTLNFTGVWYARDYNLSKYNLTTLMIYGVESVDGQQYPNGAMPLTIYYNFINKPYGNEEVPDEMSTSAVLLYPVEKYPHQLPEAIFTWNEPVSASKENIFVTLQIDNGMIYNYVPAKINEDGNLAVDLKDFAFDSEGTPVSGNYYFTLPSGIIKNASKEINKEQMLTVKVYKLKGEPNVTFNVEETTGNISRIHISWDADSKHMATGESGEIKATGSSGTYTFLPSEITVDETGLAVDLKNVKLSGKYTVNIPAKYLTIGEDHVNDAYDYVVSNITTGIDTIMSENSLRIYNLKGQRLNASSVSELPNGIYIVNGRKFIVVK